MFHHSKITLGGKLSFVLIGSVCKRLPHRTSLTRNRSQKKKLFRVLRQCVVFSSRSNIGKDECSAVMDILLTHTLKLRIMHAMPVGQALWADHLE